MNTFDFAALPALVAAQPRLGRWGREQTFSFRVVDGGAETLVKIEDGQVVSAVDGTFAAGSWDFSLTADRSVWSEFLAEVPAPGFHDLIALLRYARLKVDGGELIFMRNMLFIKGVLATMRKKGNRQ